jgi:hypothetical protein
MIPCACGNALTSVAVKEANWARSDALRGVSAERPFQTTRKSLMWLARVDEATLRIPRRRVAEGRVCPRVQAADSTTASKPARWEMSTWERAEAGSCWARESSTTPTLKLRRRGLSRPGGGGMAAVVAGTSEDERGGATAVVLPEDVGPRVRVELAAALPGPGCALPPPEETITAMIAPVTAASARPPRSRAFLTKPEATLAAG